MADSDDEYDRRRGRDKFRKERSDYQERREERGRRDDWVDSRRDSWSRDRTRRDYREYDPRRRDRYSPPRHDISPPLKRMRRAEWTSKNKPHKAKHHEDHIMRPNREDRGYPGYDMGFGAGAMMGSHQSWGPPHDMGGLMHGFGGPGGGQRNDQDMGPTQPPMMTFKQFLASQDDTISDEEAVRKYNEYKLEFRRQQLNEFFLSHKEEEWFKSKYHPEECGKRQAELLAGLKKRVDVFLEMLETNRIDSVLVDADKADDIVKLLDSVVIKLEGGTEHDLKILDQPLEEEKPEIKPEPFVPGKKDEEEEKKEKEEKETDPSKMTITSEQKELQRKAKEFLKKKAEEDGKESGEKKRKRNKEYSYDEIEDSGSDSDSESEPAPPGVEDEPPPPGMEDNVSNDEAKAENIADTEESKLETLKEDASSSQDGEIKPEIQDETSQGDVEPKLEEPSEDPSEAVEENGEPKPRPLHKTCSIFLRNLAPTITKQEVEAMCKRYPGFLRVAIADPQPERRFFRRGWVTFERGVNIKEICWNLNNIRLRDCELGAIVNRDLTRRIRSVSGITSHKQVVRADIKISAKIIQNLDSRHELWTDDTETKDGSIPSFGLISKNPLLKNITDYLIEEASAEEEELLGTADQEEKKESEGTETTIERDEALIKVMDRLLLYLRLVHSVDYYNHSDYPNEDEMPNRCGIMHARGPPPSSKVTQQEINEYSTTFEQKISPFLMPLTKLSDEEALKLGKKDPEAEVEKFIQANTQELAKDKWLCPLSGKKFKGPEFVRKHIFNKHAEKIEEVKKEVEYFNNYLLDPKRPQLPEHPGNKMHSNNSMSGRGEGYGSQPPGFQPSPQYPYGYGQGSRGHMGPIMYQGGLYPSPNYGGRGSFDPYRPGGYYGQKRSRGPARNDPRELIHYRDLDAPTDLDLI